MSNHLRRIESVERDLKSLSSASSKKEDVHKLREEMKKVYVSVRASLHSFLKLQDGQPISQYIGSND